MLVDTHALVWFATGDPRLSDKALAALQDADATLFVSAITAFEFADLNRRGRFGADLSLGPVLAALRATVLDFPAGCWHLAELLPDIHRDPVDRLLIAHAIQADLPVVTADTAMRAYPVRTLW